MPKLDMTRAVRIKDQGGEILRLRGPGFDWWMPSAVPVWSITPLDGSAMINGYPPFSGPWLVAAGDASATIITFPEA
jgi:hypothetical protein